MWSITGLNPFNLSIYGLSARCPTLKTIRYRMASKDSLPVAGLPYGTGVSPAKSHDLARPHSKSDPPDLTDNKAVQQKLLDLLIISLFP